MSQFPMMPDLGGARRRRRPDDPEDPAFDIQRAQRERQRVETQLRELDKRIMGSRQQARRAGTTYDGEADLLRRNDLRRELLDLGTALRPERQQTTADEVMAKRADLQQQGLRQAQGDLSAAMAPPSPERMQAVQDATRQRTIAELRARQAPGANVPSNDLLPSNIARTAAGELVRQQGTAIDSATRRLDAFEGFGFTPDQAASRAEEANAAAARRNTERLDTQARLVRTFAEQDATAAQEKAHAEAVAQAERERRIAEIQAQQRALNEVGQPDPMEELDQQFRRAEIAKAQAEAEALGIGNKASQAILDQQGAGGLGQDGSLSGDKARALLAASDQQEVFGALGGDASANVITALDRATQGAFDERDAIENQRALDLAMAQLDALPDELRRVEAQNLLTRLGGIATRDPEGTWFQFLRATTRGAATRDPDKIPRRLEQNQVMRARAQQAMAQLRQWAGTQ